MQLRVLLVVVAILSLSSAVFHGGASSRDRESRSFVKRRGPARLHLPADLKERLSRPEPFTYPAARLSVREKRSDDSDGQCGLAKSSVLETDPVKCGVCLCLCLCACT